ncbi:MAG TPA: hypothetical protein VGG06_27645 [Thermoanaerobaculia bacterium]|jgi:hypothetical protein
MRKVTESLFRFGWAMTTFGLQQALHLAAPRRGWDEAERGFDAIAAAAAKEMDEALRTYYRAGDRLQAGLVDTASRLFSSRWSEPGELMNETWESLDRTRARVQEALAEEEAGG